MKKSNWQVLVVIVFASVLCSKGWADSAIKRNELSIKQEMAKLEYASYQGSQEQRDEAMSGDIYEFKEKSTKKAFIYSLFIPGAGEYYAESGIKTGIFLGLEAAFWIGYFSYHSKGQDKESQFMAYADQYWDKNGYIEFLGDSCNVNSPTSDLEPCVYGDNDTSYWTHHLPDTKNQEYYEMIGKYDQFVYGWEDTQYPSNAISDLRETYMDMRYDANKLFDKAKYAVMGVLANHLLSAFDAAYTAKRYNQKADRFAEINFKIRMIEREDELIPKALVTLKFR